MNAATWPRARPERDRLLVLDAERGAIAHDNVGNLDRHVSPGDVLVVNDAATLPAAWRFVHDGAPCELRLLLLDGEGGALEADAIVLGPGSSEQRTEDREPPPTIDTGCELALVGGVVALVVESRGRRLRVRFAAPRARVLSALYRCATPVRYAYLERQPELYHVTLPFAGRPWASEMPSAGRGLTFGLLSRLRQRGARVVRVTHGAGLSSTGDAELDRALPFTERYAIDSAAALEIEAARSEGRRIVAVGTSVVRALESAAREGAHGRVRAGCASTSLRVDEQSERLVVDAVLTGMHEPDTSHFALLEAFASRAQLMRANREADAAGYLLHEFGDSMLVVGEARRAQRRAASAA